MHAIDIKTAVTLSGVSVLFQTIFYVLIYSVRYNLPSTHLAEGNSMLYWKVPYIALFREIILNQSNFKTLVKPFELTFLFDFLDEGQ